MKKLLRSILFALALFGAMTAKAQNYYVFYNTSYGYLCNENGNLRANTSFDANCVWIASGAMGTNNRTLQSYSDQTLYLYVAANNSNQTASLRTTSANYWQTRDTYLAVRNNYTTRYLKRTSKTAFGTADGNNGQRFIPYAVTRSAVATAITDPTISGADVLTATGTSSYTASGAAYRLGYTNYAEILNAKDFGVPQNRERIFLVSVRNDVGLRYHFPKPFKLTKCLADILEENVDEKFFLRDEMLARFCEKSLEEEIVPGIDIGVLENEREDGDESFFGNAY